MRFKDYINESVEVDPSKINITNEDFYEFQFDGEKYKVVFRDYPGLFTKCKSIGFKGPTGHSPTGTSGFKAPQVYGIMLSVVIAYVEKYKPFGLDFYGATDTMDLLYKRFADRYAKDEPGKPADKVYLRLSDSQWIRKDVYEALPPAQRQEADERLADWNRQEARYLKTKREEGNMRRNLFIKYKDYIGGFIFEQGIDGWGLNFKYWFIFKSMGDHGYIRAIPISYDSPSTSFKPNEGMKFFSPDDLSQVPSYILAKSAEILIKNNTLKSLPNGAYDKIIQAARERSLIS